MRSSKRREDTQVVYQLPLTLDEPAPELHTHYQEESIHTRKGASELRERIQRYGVQTLSSGELLSLVLCTTAARDTLFERVEALLREYEGLAGLMRADFTTLCNERLGKVKTAQLMAVLEISRRLTMPEEKARYRITSPNDAERLVRADMAYLDHEEMRVLVLNTKNDVIANVLLYRGTLNSSVLRAAELFRLAIARNGAGIILVHNHPSGDPLPSPEDEEVTAQLVTAGKLIEIEVVDHIIIGHNNKFVSLHERMRW